MKKHYLLFILLFTLAISDIFLLNISLFLGYYLTNKYLVDVNHLIYVNNIWSCTIIWLLCTGIVRLYRYTTMQNLHKIYKLTLRSLALYGVSFSGYVLYTNESTFPIEFLASLLPIVGMLFVLSRFTAKALRELLPNTVVEGVIAKDLSTENQVRAIA
ncbi:MAG: hypothetical protein H7Y07_18340 [Pyrinomonadaceae bacterium]|nr:hypothetical protein [Sphingobacteriaceae bacterium]